MLHAALLGDTELRSTDAAQRERAEQELSFLIPICKGLLTELSNQCTYDALQILGGHGYIAEWGMEQFAHDARITTIYEGTTQIQALDLLGRKVFQLQGAGLKLFLERIGAFCQQHADNAPLAEFVAPLGKLAQQWGEITQRVGVAAAGNPDEIGAAAVDYLFYSGYITLAYFWARSVAAADAGARSAEFKRAKRATARFYFQRILPRTEAHATSLRAGAASLMDLPEELFG